MVPGDLPEETERFAAYGRDRELSAALRVLSTAAPELRTVAEPTDVMARQAAHEQIARTVAHVEMFTDDVYAVVCSTNPAAPASSTRAIALSVATVCRRFAHTWRHLSEITPATVAEFNHDLRGLQAALDGLIGGP